MRRIGPTLVSGGYSMVYINYCGFTRGQKVNDSSGD